MMLTVAYVGNGEIDVRDVEPAPPPRGEVRIRVAYVGLCGTDIHILHGAMDARVATPLTFGHEMSGTIDAIGEEVVGWEIGDPVTVMPLRWDGTCAACRAGHVHVCQNLNFIGIDSPGALQPLWNVPAGVVVPLEPGTPLEAAALSEPVAVAVHDVRRSELSAGDRAVVIGGGPIGVLIATVARLHGAGVVLLEVDEGRRQRAAALGIPVLDPQHAEPAAWIEEWTGGAGADVVFEVSGAASAVLGAAGLAKVRGTIVIVAIHPRPREIDLQRVFWRELRLLGARVYERRDFDEAIALIAAGAIPTAALTSGVVPITSVGEAFDDLESGRAMKILVDVQSGQRLA